MRKHSGAAYKGRLNGSNSNSNNRPSDEDDNYEDDDDNSVGVSSLSRKREQRDRMAFANAALFSEATSSAVRAGSTAAPSNAAASVASSTSATDASASNAASSKGSASAPPAKLVSILSSTGFDDVSYNDDGTPVSSSSGKSRGAGGVSKKVSWVEGVAESKSANLAASIPRHKIKDGDYVVYIVELYRSGRSWTLRKRYSEFCRLHEALIAEGLITPAMLPRLPSKRWFRWLRWSNRFEERATTQRRQQLQEYLRALLKWDLLVTSSRVLQKFLEVNRSLAIDNEDQEQYIIDEDGIERNSFYYEEHPVMEEVDGDEE